MNINQTTMIILTIFLTTLTPVIAADSVNKGNSERDKLSNLQVVDSQMDGWDDDDHRDYDHRHRNDHNDNTCWDVTDRRDNDSRIEGKHMNNDDRDINERLDNYGERNTDSRNNENSNRQSDPDSSRGQERAAERHSDNANKHMQTEEEQRPRRWYDFIIVDNMEDADKDKTDDLTDKKPRWWWPFN